MTEYTGDEFVAFSEGFTSGYVAGIERGRQLADDEAAALWRNAARIVHTLANVPTHDELEAIRRDYSPRPDERGGEGQTA